MAWKSIFFTVCLLDFFTARFLPFDSVLGPIVTYSFPVVLKMEVFPAAMVPSVSCLLKPCGESLECSPMGPFKPSRSSRARMARAAADALLEQLRFLSATAVVMNHESKVVASC